MRFQIIEASPDAWTVFDAVLGSPAEFQGRALVGLSRSDAELMAARVTARSLSWRPGGPSHQLSQLAASSAIASTARAEQRAA